MIVTSATLPNPYGALPSEDYMKTIIDAVEVGGPSVVPPRSLAGGGEKLLPPTGLQALGIKYKFIKREWFVSCEDYGMVIHSSNKEVA